MATGRIRRSARRGVAAAMLGWLGAAGAVVLLAPGASAAPTATVTINDVTPPSVAVDAGGSVTFVNGLADKTVSVGGLVPVNAIVHTDVTLQLPSGSTALAPGQSVTRSFPQTTTFTITYAYRVDGATVAAVSGLLPPIKAPTPFVVNTLVPAVPNLPSVGLPPLPQVTVPPLVPPPPAAPPVPAPPVGEDPPPTQPPGEAPGENGEIIGGATGENYAYGTGTGAPQMAPSDVAAAAAFDPARFSVPGRSVGSPDRAGSGGMAGSYDGASVPVFGQLAGLDGSSLDEESAEETGASPATAQALPAAALAAVVALAAVTAALIRTSQAARSSR